MDAGRRWQTLGLCALPVACAVLFLADPADGGIYPPCPFRAITGYDCPGCGSARGMHELMHGRLGDAFTLNPLLVIALPVLAFVIATMVASVVRGRPLRAFTLPSWMAYVAVAAVLVFGIVRNLPFDAVAWMASYR